MLRANFIVKNVFCLFLYLITPFDRALSAEQDFSIGVICNEDYSFYLKKIKKTFFPNLSLLKHKFDRYICISLDYFGHTEALIVNNLVHWK